MLERRMATVEEVNEAIQSGLIVEFVYKEEARTVNPVELLETKAGKVVLVGQEEAKGWRRYSIEDIEGLQLVSFP